jgi:hypothetical protein
MVRHVWRKGNSYARGQNHGQDAWVWKGGCTKTTDLSVVTITTVRMAIAHSLHALKVNCLMENHVYLQLNINAQTQSLMFVTRSLMVITLIWIPVAGHITIAPRDTSLHMYALVLTYLMEKNVWIQVATNVHTIQVTVYLCPMDIIMIKLLDATSISTVQTVTK